MKKLVEAMLDDLSTREVFLFQTRCDACGREYKSKPLRFSKAGAMPSAAQKQTAAEAAEGHAFLIIIHIHGITSKVVWLK